MAGLRFIALQARPLEFLDFTSVTLDEFQQLVPPFEAAFQARMAAWRMDGKPRTARRFTVVLIAMIAGWIQRHQQQVIPYLHEENRVLKAQLGGRRLPLTDTERRRLATLAHPLGRTRLQEVATIATPETLLRWYKRLIAQKFDGSTQRRQRGRPRVAEEMEQLVVCMAEENRTWGYRRIQGALANLGHAIDALTVRNILSRHHLGPAPTRRQTGMRWGQFLKLHWEVLAATDFFTVEVATWCG